MGNPLSPPNGNTNPQSLDYLLPDAGGNATGTGGNTGYLKRGKGTGGGYAPTGAADKTLNTVVETHQDGDTFSADPIEIVTAGVGSDGKTHAIVTDASGYPIALRDDLTTWKTVQATASGATAAWTPATGKKFRLLRLMLLITANASLAAGAVLTVTLQDASTDTGLSFDAFVPTTAVTTTAGDAFNSGWIELGQGFLSSTADNVLNVNLSAALATGNVRVIVAGREE